MLFLSLFLSLSTYFSPFFAFLFLSPFSFLFLVLSALCQPLSYISKDKNGEGGVFMMVNIFHDVLVLSVVSQPILSPGEQGLGIIRNSK